MDCQYLSIRWRCKLDGSYQPMATTFVDAGRVAGLGGKGGNARMQRPRALPAGLGHPSGCQASRFEVLGHAVLAETTVACPLLGRGFGRSSRSRSLYS